MHNRKVFIPNKSHHDYSDAKRFGELTYVTSGVQNKYNTTLMARLWEDALKESTEYDYLLQTSLSVLNSIGVAMFACKHGGKGNILIWQKGKYIERTLVFNKGE